MTIETERKNMRPQEKKKIVRLAKKNQYHLGSPSKKDKKYREITNELNKSKRQGTERVSNYFIFEIKHNDC